MLDRILSSLMLGFLSSSSKSMTNFFSRKPRLEIKMTNNYEYTVKPINSDTREPKTYFNK